MESENLVSAILLTASGLALGGLVWSITRTILHRHSQAAFRLRLWDRAVLMLDPSVPLGTLNLLLKVRKEPLDTQLWGRIREIVGFGVDGLPPSQGMSVVRASRQPSLKGRIRYVSRLLGPEAKRLHKIVRMLDAIESRKEEGQRSAEARRLAIASVRKWSTMEFGLERPPAPKCPLRSSALQEVECRLCGDTISVTPESTCPYCGLFSCLWQKSDDKRRGTSKRRPPSIGPPTSPSSGSIGP